jgi:hypothetical protein
MTSNHTQNLKTMHRHQQIPGEAEETENLAVLPTSLLSMKHNQTCGARKWGPTGPPSLDKLLLGPNRTRHSQIEGLYMLRVKE